MVFANLTYFTAPTTNNTSDDSSLLAQVVGMVKSWLESMKIFVEDGLVRLKELVADKLTAKKAVLDKIELKDEDSGEIYCVRIKGGALLSTLGECTTTQTNDSQPTTDNEPEEQTTQEADTTPLVVSDAEPPVITLNGPSTIELEKGTSWSDPGATVTDNVNDNLGIYYKINNEPTGNEGRDLPNLDTNLPGTYTITYTATDQAGNTTEATRTVTVNEPTTNQTSETSSSTPETQG